MFKHFTIEELTSSDRARELGIDNTPDKDSIEKCLDKSTANKY